MIDKKTFAQIGRNAHANRLRGVDDCDLSNIVLNTLIDTCDLVQNIKELAEDRSALAIIKFYLRENMNVIGSGEAAKVYRFCDLITDIIISALEIQDTYEIARTISEIRDNE